MRKFEKYFAAIDGTSDWSKIRPLFDEAFHADCIFVTAGGKFNKEQWATIVKGLVDKRATVSDFAINREEGDTVYYQFTVDAGEGEPMRMKAKGTLENGQLLRVEPMDPAAYSAMVERSK